jgi:ABC-type branched-subunit amino acid transport system ATPase component
MADELRADRLAKAFAGTVALADINFRIPLGRIVGIVGPNGAGKTTLFDIVSGFLRPDSGACYFGSRKLTKLAPHRIVAAGVARTFQEPRGIATLAAVDNVCLALPPAGTDSFTAAMLPRAFARQRKRNRDQAMEQLRLVGLLDQAEQPVSELSYGQRKLLALACCLTTGARVLLLDEPVAGVHRELISQISAVLAAARDAGKLVLLVEHNLEVVRSLADHAMVMSAGHIVAQGPAAQVLSNRDLLGAYLGTASW